MIRIDLRQGNGLYLNDAYVMSDHIDDGVDMIQVAENLHEALRIAGIEAVVSIFAEVK